MNAVVTLLARVLLAQIFLLAGLSKLGAGYAATQAYMQSMGVPGLLLGAVIALELGGGVALLFGFLTRWAALALAAFSVLSALLFHANAADQMQMVMFLKNLGLAGGLLLLFAHGAGPLSLDARRDSASRL